jgi:hypothetical protein
MQDSTLRETIKVSILAVSVFIAFGIVFYIAPKRGDIVVYNCSIAEISPDFPLEVKEKCRKLNTEK